MSNCKCKYCNSDNTLGIARIVGYFSILQNWNKSKLQERKDRNQSHFSETDTKGIGFVGFGVSIAGEFYNRALFTSISGTIGEQHERNGN